MIEKKKKKLIKYILIFVSIVLVIFFSLRISVLRDVMYLLFISFTISYTLRPIQNRMCENGMSKRTSSIILILTLFIVFIAAFTFLIPSILKESLNLNNAFSNIEEFINNFYSKLKPIKSNRTMYIIIENANNKISSSMINIFSKVFDSLLNAGQNILAIAVIPIISYYFLSDGEYIGNKILNMFPTKCRKLIKKISYDIDKVLGRYIVSQLLLCLIIGVATFVILLLLKIDFPIILSLFNAFFNIVPYFGPIFGAIPIIFIALIKSPKTALWAAIWVYIIQQIEGNILSPKITGDSVSMHPLTVIILLVIGGKVAGFLGMILAIPLGVVIKVVYEDLNYYFF